MALSYGTVLHCERCGDTELGGQRKRGQSIPCAQSDDRKIQRGELTWG